MVEGAGLLTGGLEAVHLTLEQLQGSLASVRSNDVQDGEQTAIRQTSRSALEFGRAKRKSRFADESSQM
eukprot:3317251-Amphidinium_carterae.1